MESSTTTPFNCSPLTGLVLVVCATPSVSYALCFKAVLTIKKFLSHNCQSIRHDATRTGATFQCRRLIFSVQCSSRISVLKDLLPDTEEGGACGRHRPIKASRRRSLTYQALSPALLRVRMAAEVGIHIRWYSIGWRLLHGSSPRLSGNKPLSTRFHMVSARNLAENLVCVLSQTTAVRRRRTSIRIWSTPLCIANVFSDPRASTACNWYL